MTLLDEVRDARNTPPLPSPGTAKLIREAAGVSQARLADELGVHRMTVVRWETGERSPRGVHRVMYARLLHDLRLLVAS